MASVAPGRRCCDTRAEVGCTEGRGREVVGFVFLGTRGGCAPVHSSSPLRGLSPESGPRVAAPCGELPVPHACPSPMRLASDPEAGTAPPSCVPLGPSHRTECASPGLGEEAAGRPAAGPPCEAVRRCSGGRAGRTSPRWWLRSFLPPGARGPAASCFLQHRHGRGSGSCPCGQGSPIGPAALGDGQTRCAVLLLSERPRQAGASGIGRQSPAAAKGWVVASASWVWGVGDRLPWRVQGHRGCGGPAGRPLPRLLPLARRSAWRQRRGPLGAATMFRAGLGASSGPGSLSPTCEHKSHGHVGSTLRETSQRRRVRNRVFILRGLSSSHRGGPRGADISEDSAPASWR